MTPEKLQDAIGQLPADLIAATDRLRTASGTKVIQWKRWIAMAVCLVLLLSTGMVFRRNILPGTGAKTESAAAPMAPQMMMDEMAAAEAAPEAPAEEVLPEPPSDVGAPEILHEEKNSAVSGGEDGLSVDHSHRFAEAEKETEEVPSGYCGNLVTRITLDGVQHDLYGADSDTVTNILRSLEYDPNTVCRCVAEFTVDTETLAGIEVNLSEAFARCELGQAALTEAQTVMLRNILNNLR